MTTKNLTNSETLDFILGSDKLSLYHILNYNYKYYFKSFNMYNFIKNNIMTLNNIQKRLKYNSYSWLLTWSLEINFFEKTKECYLLYKNDLNILHLNILELNNLKNKLNINLYTIIKVNHYYYFKNKIIDLNNCLIKFLNVLYIFYIKNKYLLLNNVKNIILINFKIKRLYLYLYVYLNLKKFIVLYFFLNKRMLSWKLYNPNDLFFLEVEAIKSLNSSLGRA